MQTTAGGRGRLTALWVAAIVAFAVFAILGALVSHGPPGAFDRAGAAFLGSGTSLAVFFTDLGLFPVYAGLCVAVLALGLVRRALWADAVAAVVSLVVAWKVSDFAKDYFARPRPEHWIVRHEPSYAYPSGHAVLALTFYGFWAAVVWSSSLASGPRRWLVAAFVALIAAIGWSRLALGAHYPSDVVGGYLLGGFALLVTRGAQALAVRRNVEPRAKSL